LLTPVAPSLGDFISRIPVPAWLQAVKNSLGFLGLGVILLFVIFLVVYLNPGGFNTGQRLAIIAGIGIFALLIYVIGALLTARAGDPLYSPAERAWNQGRLYGTDSDPQPRRKALAAPSEEVPIPNLLEGVAEAVRERLPASDEPKKAE